MPPKVDGAKQPQMEVAAFVHEDAKCPSEKGCVEPRPPSRLADISWRVAFLSGHAATWPPPAQGV